MRSPEASCSSPVIGGRFPCGHDAPHAQDGPPLSDRPGPATDGLFTPGVSVVRQQIRVQKENSPPHMPTVKRCCKQHLLGGAAESGVGIVRIFFFLMRILGPQQNAEGLNDCFPPALDIYTINWAPQCPLVSASGTCCLACDDAVAHTAAVSVAPCKLPSSKSCISAPVAGGDFMHGAQFLCTV